MKEVTADDDYDFIILKELFLSEVKLQIKLITKVQ
jgi:hypothetical protein